MPPDPGPDTTAVAPGTALPSKVTFSAGELAEVDEEASASPHQHSLAAVGLLGQAPVASEKVMASPGVAELVAVLSVGEFGACVCLVVSRTASWPGNCERVARLMTASAQPTRPALN